MEVSKHLPIAARERLVAASKVKDPFERLKAIDSAIEKAKAENPSFFRNETFETFIKEKTNEQ